MQEGQNARQQIVERIRQSTSILVALSNSPTVDALSASFALSLMLTKMNKHSTAVFSGQIPPAIQFLEPNKTFESNVDALRDFIISLDKEKADRLRYKVEDDVVRIFITPYKTSISEKDLEFSQGDFNVDLIIALGVEKRDDLDKAIVAHGRILHDATIITINPNTQHSSLGSIDWNDGSSSSLCEMLVTLSEAFQQPGLLDAQISTALLTGIVAATERFSNTHTSPRVMTMAAQLMAAGANQQLIATNLAKAQAPVAAPQTAGTLAKQPPSNQPTPMQEEPPKKKEPGELDIAHEKKPEPAPQPLKVEEKPAPAPEPPKETSAEEELAAALPGAPTPGRSFIELKNELENAGKKEEAESPEPEHKAPGSASVNGDEEEIAKQPEHEEEYLSSHSSWKGKRLEPPTLGGTLNATTEEAMEDSKKAEEEDRNKMLLTHPEDRQNQGQSKRKNKKDRQNQNQNRPPAEPVVPVPAPMPAPEPAPAAPAPEPAPAPVPIVEPTPVAPPDLPPLPPLPTFNPEPTPPAPEPMPAPEPAPVPLPPAPAPEPVVPPAPEPAPAPAPAPEPEPNLDTLAASAAEAAAAAQPAAAAAGEIDNARQAVSNALDAAPFNPANQPSQSVGAQEVPPMPNMPVSEPLSQDALRALPPAPNSTPAVPAPAPSATDLPPLPPMPPMPPTSDALPPAPNLPGLNQPLPPMAPDVSSQPQNPPTPPAPSDPAQFKIPGA